MSNLTWKTPLVALLTAVSYSSMVIDIIMIKKVKNDSTPGNKKYPPAVVAMLVCSIFQFFWCIFYLVRSGKGLGLRASSIAGTIVFFLLFNVGAIGATTGLRHHNGYCSASASNVSDCSGVLRGVEALGFSLIGLDLLYLGFLAALVSGHGSWSSEPHNMPEPRAPNSDLEKAPAH